MVMGAIGSSNKTLGELKGLFFTHSRVFLACSNKTLGELKAILTLRSGGLWEPRSNKTLGELKDYRSPNYIRDGAAFQ